MTISEYAGELAGLGAALAWAITSLIFIRVDVSAGAINLFKNAASCLLLAFTVLFFAVGSEAPLDELTIFHLDSQIWSWLIVSAVVGLAIGDTFYFRSLQILGPRRCLLVMTLSPPMGAALGYVFLGERLGLWSWAGIFVTVAGVTWVIRERTPEPARRRVVEGGLALGTFWGTLGALGNALGGIYSKKAMDAMRGELTPLDVNLVRMAIAVACGFGYYVVRRELGAWARSVTANRAWLRLVPASLIGTYLGVWLVLKSYEKTEAGIAITMQSTSPIFVLPLAYLVHRQKVSWRAVLGALVAVGGIALLFVR